MITSLVAAALFASLATPAHAGSCDSLARKVDAAKGPALVTAFQALAKCDAELARTGFVGWFKKAETEDVLVPLALAALDAHAYEGLWEMMDALPFEFRGPVAKAIGEGCATHADVEPFLKASYIRLKDRAFTAWEPALLGCAEPGVQMWIEGLVAEPPASAYDGKYNALLGVFRRTRHAGALATLEQAAIKAGERGGPFNPLLDAIQRAVEPEDMRATTSAEDEAAMVETLVRVAKAVPPESARAVADRLVTAGHEKEAAGLLPAIYPDRVQGDGSLMWAAAALEMCDGAGVLHWVAFTRQPTTWSVGDAAEAPLRATKPKLKCDADGAWPVYSAESPLADQGAAAAWASTLASELGTTHSLAEVKAVHEKKVVIP